jgi:hypothetical protein
MNKEFLQMQKLAGLITESEVKSKINEVNVDNMNNIQLVQFILSKVESLREEIIDLTHEVKDEDNYDLVFDTLSTEVESDLINLIDTFNLLIDDLDDLENPSGVEIKNTDQK